MAPSTGVWRPSFSRPQTAAKAYETVGKYDRRPADQFRAAVPAAGELPKPMATATPRTPIRTPAIRFHLAGSPATKTPDTMTLMKAVLAFTMEARPPVTNCWP